MKIIWDGFDLILVGVAAIMLLLCAVVLIVEHIKQWWKGRKNRRAE